MSNCFIDKTFCRTVCLYKESFAKGLPSSDSSVRDVDDVKQEIP